MIGRPGSPERPRLLSVNLCQEQVAAREKWATIRKSPPAKPGDHVFLVDKMMGRRVGEPCFILARVRVISIEHRAIAWLSDSDARLDGFPELSARDFRAAICKLYAMNEGGRVWQVRFAYLDQIAGRLPPGRREGVDVDRDPSLGPCSWKMGGGYAVESWPCRSIAEFENPSKRRSSDLRRVVNPKRARQWRGTGEKK